MATASQRPSQPRPRIDNRYSQHLSENDIRTHQNGPSQQQPRRNSHGLFVSGASKSQDNLRQSYNGGDQTQRSYGSGLSNTSTSPRLGAYQPARHSRLRGSQSPYENSQNSSDSSLDLHEELYEEEQQQVPQLAYAHLANEKPKPLPTEKSSALLPVPRNATLSPEPQHLAPIDRAPNRRKSSNAIASMYSVHGDIRGRAGSPGFPAIPGSTNQLRARSAHSFDSRPRSSYSDYGPNTMLARPTTPTLDNSHLRSVVGSDANLMSQMKTIELYRKNAEKTNEPTILYEFAIFLISAAQAIEVSDTDSLGSDSGRKSPKIKGKRSGSPTVESPAVRRSNLLKEARQILQRLSNSGFPYAQYFYADGLCSGLFTEGKPDLEKAFGLFVSASKHGHAESGYRAGLHYEFGWGCRKDPIKAQQFYRSSASKNHPGAMTRLAMACLKGDLGLDPNQSYREGIKWLKRATESADEQYPNAPYDLGLLHEQGDNKDIFKDLTYTAQLFAQAADLGHAQASFRLGQAYEKGELECPQDTGLSVHYYTGAAEKNHPEAMMALCAWYLVGAPPLLERDEDEAYAWAKQAADLGLPSAMYAVGFFTEQGSGCNRDELEANKWYTQAAELGDERAKRRLETLRIVNNRYIDSLDKSSAKKKNKKGSPTREKSSSKDEKDCIIM